jgi:hypothetical protein
MSGIKAVAKYEERGTRRKFNFELEKAAARQTYTVTATTNGKTVTMGTFVANGLGRGIIDIDTREGDFVHDLAVGSRITLMAAGRSYSGVLR